MAITITLWPTLDALSAIDGNLSAASFDTNCADDYWDELEIINIYIIAREDDLTLSGFEGAWLTGWPRIY
jgi:hypothetical protein